MAFIKYEEELVEEEIYSGVINNSAVRQTEEELRRQVFDIMAKDGISIDNPDDYKIVFLGNDEIDEDLYFNPTSNFKVLHQVKKEIPYEVEREEIFSTTMDTYLLRSEEESRKKIRELMAEAGVNVTDQDVLEISYSSLDEDIEEDLYYNPLTKVSVYKVTKTKIEEEEEKTSDNPEKEKLEQALKELEDLKKQLHEAEEKNEIVNRIYSLSLDKLFDEIAAYRKSVVEDDKIDIEEVKEDVDDRIKEVQASLKSLVKEYDDCYNELKELKEEEEKELDNNRVNNQEEIRTIREKYISKKEELDKKSVRIRRLITEKQRELEDLKKEKDVLNSEAYKAAALGLTVEEYNEITDTLQKKKIFNAILEAKGLSDIADKPYKERTPEEKALIKEAKEEMIEEIAKLRSEDNISVTDAINALYDIEVEMSRGDHPRVLKVTPKDFESLNGEIKALPEKVLSHETSDKVDYIPEETPEDMQDVEDNRELVFSGVKTKDTDIAAAIQRDFGKDIRNNLDDYEIDIKTNPDTNQEEYNVYKRAKDNDKVLALYHNKDDDRYYVKKDAIDEFNFGYDNTVDINGETYYRINDVAVSFIRNNPDSSYTPDRIEDYELEEEIVKDEEILPSQERKESRERIVVFIDEENNDKFVKKAVLSRFNLEPMSQEVIIGGVPCIKIDDEDYEYVIGNADNSFSPYFVEERKIRKTKEDDAAASAVDDSLDISSVIDDLLDNDNSTGTTAGDDSDNKSDDNKTDDNSTGTNTGDDSDSKSDDNNKNPNEEHVKIYRDLNGDMQAYATKEVLNRFGISSIVGVTSINGNDCYPVSSDALQIIEHLAKQSTSPKIIIDYEDISIKKHVRPHPQEIIQKLTDGLEIRKKDAQRYRGSNIQFSSALADDLRSGNILYNVIHVAVTGLKALSMVITKIASKIMLTDKAKEVMQELEKRVNELTEEELEVLFEEYKGGTLKADMNTQILSMILPRVKAYGLEKVQVLNGQNKIHYANLFIALEKLEAIEEQLKRPELDPAVATQLKKEHTRLTHDAADLVKKIDHNRKEANNFLSGGVHGLEEDYKAVMSKMSYVGRRFAETHDFNNELQQELAKYGHGLNVALAEGNDHDIVENFINLEMTYANNTRIEKGRFGDKSVGEKYYSPLVEQFDYRDDPFIRDILVTFALSSAIFSAINAVQVHAFQSNDLQAEINSVNAHNDAVIRTVHDSAANIQADADAIQEGMAVQAHENVLNTANVLERESLDMTNWSFDSLYHETDSVNHEFFNGFYQNVSSDIDNITSQYASGAISQTEALQQMADVANSSHQTLVNVTNESLTILRDYAASHPEFDLSGIEASMQYIVAHPNAIAEMNQAAVDANTVASTLSGLSIEHATALSALPSDMLSTLVCAASAAALSYRVATTMNDKYKVHRKYGNEVVDMMQDYINRRVEQSNAQGRGR